MVQATLGYGLPNVVQRCLCIDWQQITKVSQPPLRYSNVNHGTFLPRLLHCLNQMHLP